jgi:hypothetical protein
MERVFHRVQVIHVTEELIEAMHGGQEFIAITEVIFTELASRVAHRLEGLRDRRGLRR